MYRKAYQKLLQWKNEEHGKCAEYTDTCYVLHTADFKEENGITYLPVYMTAVL